MAPTEVKLNELRTVLEEVTYPTTRASAAAELQGVVLNYADGSEPLVDVLDRCASDGFETAEDLEAEVFSNLPTEAVGEPGQSEGDA